MRTFLATRTVATDGWGPLFGVQTVPGSRLANTRRGLAFVAPGCDSRRMLPWQTGSDSAGSSDSSNHVAPPSRLRARYRNRWPSWDLSSPGVLGERSKEIYPVLT